MAEDVQRAPAPRRLVVLLPPCRSLQHTQTLLVVRLPLEMSPSRQHSLLVVLMMGTFIFGVSDVTTIISIALFLRTTHPSDLSFRSIFLQLPRVLLLFVLLPMVPHPPKFTPLPGKYERSTLSCRLHQLQHDGLHRLLRLGGEALVVGAVSCTRN